MQFAKLSALFNHIAKWTARMSGRPLTFVLAVLLIVVWAVLGPVFKYSDTWQLVINTGTTIVTFLMVFLIQNTQNRDTAAMHIKLDEIIRSQAGAHNALLDLEELEEEDLLELRANYLALAEKARERLKRGKPDTESPEVGEGHRKVIGRIKGGRRKPR